MEIMIPKSYMILNPIHLCKCINKQENAIASLGVSNVTAKPKSNPSSHAYPSPQTQNPTDYDSPQH